MCSDRRVLLTGFEDWAGLLNPTKRLIEDHDLAVRVASELAREASDVRYLVESQVLAVSIDAVRELAADPQFARFFSVVGLGLDARLTSFVADLADDVREQLIAASGTQGFERPEEINAFIYFADPNRFGLMSYLHYRRPENGDAYLRKILGQR